MPSGPVTICRFHKSTCQADERQRI